jgi:hypothetical protein
MGIQDQAFEVPVAMSTSASPLGTAPGSPEAGAAPAEGAERSEAAATEPPPKEVTAPPKLELSVDLDRFFAGEDDEPKKTIQIELKTATAQLGATGGRRRATLRKGAFALNTGTTQESPPAAVPERPPPAEAPERPPVDASVDPFAEAAQGQESEQNANDISTSGSTGYMSSLFF